MSDVEMTPAEKALEALKKSIARDHEIFAPKSVDAAIEYVQKKMAIGDDSATLTRRFAVMAFDIGTVAAADKKANAAPDVTPLFEAWNKRFRGGDTGRAELKPGTIPTYRSYSQAWTGLGFVRSWDPRPNVLPYLLQNVSKAGSWGDRGSVIREISAMATEPDNAAMAALIAGKKDAPDLQNVADASVRAVEAIIKKHESVKTALSADGPIRKAYAAYVLAGRAFAAAVKENGAGGGEDDALADIIKDAA